MGVDDAAAEEGFAAVSAAPPPLCLTVPGVLVGARANCVLAGALVGADRTGTAVPSIPAAVCFAAAAAAPSPKGNPIHERAPATTPRLEGEMTTPPLAARSWPTGGAGGSAMAAEMKRELFSKQCE